MNTYPMPPPHPSGGSYHPDYMFCGSCTSCQEPSNKIQLGEGETLESYIDEEEGLSTAVILKTKFHLREPVSNPSHILVIQSLLRPLPGVFKVILNSADQAVQIEHDSSLSTESVLSALESVGHPGYIHNAPSSSSEAMVRSHLYVQGICCASEIPAVRKIVKSLAGVSKLQINITTKMVIVQHDSQIVQAQQIANALSKEGFVSKVQRDGQATALAKRQAMNHGRTTLHVNGILVEQDIPRIQQTLSRLPGTSRIGVNVSETVIYVDHNVYALSSAQLVEALMPDFNCTVAVAAERAVGDATAAALDQIGRSRYVESTISVEGLSHLDVKTVEKAISQNFIRAQVRAVYPNIVSQTVKVEHDPKLVSILDICNTISSYGLKNAQVSVNGADLGMYLPLQEDYPSNRVVYAEEPSLSHVHANVWLSGIFWVLSMVSYQEGR